MNTEPNLFPKQSLPIAEREELFHKMIEEVEDYAILLLDKEGHILNWNKGAEKIKGYKEKEIVSKHFSIFYTKEDQANKLPQTLLQQGEKTGKAHHEGWRVRKDGSYFWGSIVITAIHNDAGTVIGYTKVTRDLTERKISEESTKAKNAELARINEELLLARDILEQKLVELNKANKDLEQFAYIASHDLQEPVRKISTYFSRLHELIENKSDPQIEVLSEKIFSASKRMQTLINDLLTLSTLPDDLPLTSIDMNKVLSQVLNDLEMRIAAKEAVIRVDPLPVVSGSESYLVQLFLNLISNSLKFSKAIPQIHISAETTEQETRIRIKDNGIGMESQHLEKIFEAFQRLNPKHKYEGTGIGLTICKKILAALNGKIEAESQIGVGTTFTVILPVSR